MVLLFSVRRLWSIPAFIPHATRLQMEKKNKLLPCLKMKWLLSCRHCQNMNIKVHNFCFVPASRCHAIQSAFPTNKKHKRRIPRFVVGSRSSCGLTRRRGLKLDCAAPLHNVWLCSSRLFQATWRQSCRTRKVLSATRARFTLPPLTARWR